jgi:hypothetical protein
MFITFDMSSKTETDRDRFFILEYLKLKSSVKVSILGHIFLSSPKVSAHRTANQR